MTKFLYIILFLNNVQSSANKSRPKTELYDTFIRFTNFAPTLFGYNFTTEDEKLFATGAELQDVHLKIDEIIVKNGYPVEEYEVMSADGYVVRLFRIPGAGQPVLLLHGILLSADDWVTAGPDSGMAYMLAAEGFDVWLGNVRGTKHSRTHSSLSPDSAAYWDFSWDEMGRYDLPAMIDLVLSTTNHSQLIYVGHSQGTTAFFVMASEMPLYNDKVSLMVALAPVAAVPNLKSPFLQFVNYAALLHPDILFAEVRKYVEIELTPINLVTEIFASTACVKSRIAKSLCNNLVYLISGINYRQINFTTLPSVISHFAPGVAFKQIEHYTQSVASQRFARFDYGEGKNKDLYGCKVPPEYNVSAITTPIAMFHSINDWLASEIDTQILKNKLRNVVDFHKVRDDKFTHVDFMYAKDVRELVFKPMLKLIKRK